MIRYSTAYSSGALSCCHRLSATEAVSVPVKSAQWRVQEAEGLSLMTRRREKLLLPGEVTAGANVAQAAGSGVLPDLPHVLIEVL